MFMRVFHGRVLIFTVKDLIYRLAAPIILPSNKVDMTKELKKIIHYERLLMLMNGEDILPTPFEVLVFLQDLHASGNMPKEYYPLLYKLQLYYHLDGGFHKPLPLTSEEYEVFMDIREMLYELQEKLIDEDEYVRVASKILGEGISA